MTGISAADAAAHASHASIAQERRRREAATARRGTSDQMEMAIPEPPEHPDGPAQWDEVHGCWIAWDPASQRWLPVDADPEAPHDAPVA